jgi:hypothetical protein
MKIKLFALLTIAFLCGMTVSAQNTGKKDPVGTWKFDAPYAPEGFTTGTIVVGLAEKKHTATMSFTGSEYTIPGEQLTTANDSVFFNIYLEGQDIKVLLKLESESKMTGKAVYSEGEVPLTLTKASSL